MDRWTRPARWAAAALTGLLPAGAALAQSAPQNGQDGTVTESTTTIVEETVYVSSADWDIDVPVRLNAADPQEPCTVQLQTLFDFSTSSDGTDDDIKYIGRIEWGVIEDHSLSLQVPVMFGDGQYDGNADITLGWQWRLWKEQDWIPAFAIINELRVPNGYHSNKVDWTLTGAFTKSITECFRLHFNPFLKTINGDNIESNYRDARRLCRIRGWGDEHVVENRHFQWGFVAGFDWKINECLTLVADYVHESAELRGWRNQHSIEAGIEWKLDEKQSIVAANRMTLDGDSLEPNWGATIGYLYTFGYGR